MNQVFYREPLKTNMINFEGTTVEHKKKSSGFSFGNCEKTHVQGPTIPMYYPEIDKFEINFD